VVVSKRLILLPMCKELLPIRSHFGLGFKAEVHLAEIYQDKTFENCSNTHFPFQIGQRNAVKSLQCGLTLTTLVWTSLFFGRRRLGDAKDSKVLIVLTSNGPRALHLEGHAVASALLSLSTGQQPSGPELESIPQWAKCVVQSLEERGHGWALLSTPGELEEPNKKPTPQTSEDEFSAPLKAQLKELLDGFASKRIGAPIEPHTRLGKLVEHFLTDAEQLETLFPEIQCGMAHALGNMIGHRLSDEMGYSELDSLAGGSGRAGDQDSFDPAEVWETDEMGKLTNPEALAIVMSPSEVILRRKPFRNQLIEGIRRIRQTLYKESGYLLPGVVLRYPEGATEEEDSVVPPGEFVVARRKQVVHTGSFPEGKATDQVEFFLGVFEQLVRAHLSRWLTHSQVDHRLQLINKVEPALVDDYFRLGGTVSELRRLIIDLLECGVPVKDLHTIVEVCIETQPDDRMPVLIDRLAGTTWI
jgi:hypothetical protein